MSNNEDVFSQLNALDLHKPVAQASDSLLPDSENSTKPLRKKSALELSIESAATGASNRLAKEEEVREGDVTIKCDPFLIDPNRYQNRYRFRNLEEMAHSIKTKGQFSACIVRKSGNRYELVAGERRLRACKQFGIPTIDIIVRNYTDAEVMDLCQVENDERDDTSPVEKAIGCLIKRDVFNMSSKDIVSSTARMSSTAYHRLVCLDNLPKNLLNDLAASDISEKMTIVNCEQIGSVFRDYPDDHEEIEAMLRGYMESIDARKFSGVELARETALVIKYFLRQVKNKSKLKRLEQNPDAPKVGRPKAFKEHKAVTIAGEEVAEIVNTSDLTTLLINKKNMPKDLYDELMGLVNDFVIRSNGEIGEKQL
jgi:ParB/RepB/Spo0J family partition protein